ncbi:hypothetical protein [Parafrigoribacterium soli]|uniref:hypothetical protein n=1 Tax=Parafrigoribacterium soli TaxID=3144663 RepID=UPI0032EFE3BE
MSKGHNASRGLTLRKAVVMSTAVLLTGGMTLAGVSASASAETTPVPPSAVITASDAPIATPPSAVAQSCGSDGLLVDGYIVTNGTAEISYTIVGTAPGTYINIPNAPAKSVVPPGEYRVTVAAIGGAQLAGDTGPWLRTVEPYAGTCEPQLPSHPDWEADASATNQTCGVSGVTSGSVTVALVQEPGFEDRVQYFIGTTELTASRTEMAPGTYTVTAKPRNAGDGVYPSSWVVTVGAAAGACSSQLVTLPFTGPSDRAGLFLCALCLLLGGIALYVLSRLRARVS